MKALLRPAMIVVPLVIGFFFPQAGVLAYAPYNVVRIALFFMIFMAALGIRWKELTPRREHWKLLGVNVALGVIPFLLGKYLLPDHPEVALVLFFIGITPTAAASSVIISLLNGRVGFGLTGFAISNIGIAAAMLVLLPWTTGNFTAAFCADVAQTIMMIIALPIILAQAVRKYFPKVMTIVPKLKMVSLTVWSCLLFILAGLARRYFIAHPGESWQQAALYGTISLIFCVVNFYLGGRISGWRYRRESSQLLGQKNTVFTISLALAYAGEVVALALTFYIVWHNIYNAAQLYAFDLRKRRRNIRL